MGSTVTLLSIQGFDLKDVPNSASFPALPSTLAIDVVRDANVTRIMDRILAAEPDGTPGGMYQVHRVLGAAVANDAQICSQPAALSIVLAGAVVLSLIFTVVTNAPQREARPGVHPYALVASVPGQDRARTTAELDPRSQATGRRYHGPGGAVPAYGFQKRVPA